MIKQVEEYAHKLQLIFAPLFFAIIGAQVDLRGINVNVLIISGIIVTIAVFSKLAGCGLPSLLFLKDRKKSMTVGIGMISRGEVGLIVAGIGITSGALSSDIYTSIIIMVALTTIITLIWLKKIYAQRKDLDTPSSNFNVVWHVFYNMILFSPCNLNHKIIKKCRKYYIWLYSLSSFVPFWINFFLELN